MTISPTLGVVLMFNNYAHDVATALLAASAFCVFAAGRIRDDLGDPLATLFYLRVYRRMGRFFRCGLYWIILGGIPRTIFYSSFEWANAAGKGQVPALVIKHILLSALVVIGIVAWRRLKQRAAQLREALPEELQAQV